MELLLELQPAFVSQHFYLSTKSNSRFGEWQQLLCSFHYPSTEHNISNYHSLRRQHSLFPITLQFQVSVAYQYHYGRG